MKASELLKGLQYSVICGDEDIEIKEIYNDSRKVGAQALSGRSLSKEEMIFIGNVILADTELVRRLVVLGWDTLEVHDDVGRYGCRWKLIDYAKIGLMLDK